MTSSPGDTGRGREGIAELSEILVFDKPLDGTARDVVELARTSLEHCDGVGMQLVDRDGLSARVFTDARSSQLDALQDQVDDGPCVECLRTGQLYDLEPVTSDERWPSFAAPARRVGLIACLALPLISQDVLLGVLNLYAWPLGGFAGWDRRHCRAFARHASVSLANAQAYARTQDDIAQLRLAVSAPDDLVDQAYGVLMARAKTNLDSAMVELSELAEVQDVTLEGAAQAVLDSLVEP
jgi:GAF domain-containing protein